MSAALSHAMEDIVWPMENPGLEQPSRLACLPANPSQQKFNLKKNK
jgi:hypothetical protein